MHKIENAWRDIKFCDQERGLFGALCADILHCLQQGLFVYAHQALFERKQARSSQTNATIDFSARNVFTKSYTKYFEELALKYGFYLSHQCDRDLPRTYIQSAYTSTSRKNANEMTGILLTILTIFMTDEGTTKLDSSLADIFSTKFIHLLELLLLVENFCRSSCHKKSDVQKFKKFMPFFEYIQRNFESS